MIAHSTWLNVERHCLDCKCIWYEPAESSLGCPCPECGSRNIDDLYTYDRDTDCRVVNEEQYGEAVNEWKPLNIYK